MAIQIEDVVSVINSSCGSAPPYYTFCSSQSQKWMLVSYMIWLHLNILNFFFSMLPPLGLSLFVKNWTYGAPLFGKSFKWVFMNGPRNAHFVNFLSYEGFDYENSACHIRHCTSNEFKYYDKKRWTGRNFVTDISMSVCLLTECVFHCHVTKLQYGCRQTIRYIYRINYVSFLFALLFISDNFSDMQIS